MMPRAYERWTPAEQAFLVDWKVSGFSNRQIADRLQRSVHAVGSRITNNRLLGSKPVEVRKVVETIAIAKADVSDWYERGWRFDGFASDGRCVMTKETMSPDRDAVSIADLAHSDRAGSEASSVAA
jgi:hypothetical protein